MFGQLKKGFDRGVLEECVFEHPRLLTCPISKPAMETECHAKPKLVNTLVEAGAMPPLSCTVTAGRELIVRCRKVVAKDVVLFYMNGYGW